MSEQTMAGRVAIVTGGARGIGGAPAVEFASRGADVVIGDILPREKAAETISKIEAMGRRVAYVEGDLRQQAGNIALVDAAVQQFGRVDYVLCNAGAGLRRPFGGLHSGPGITRNNTAARFFAASWHCRWRRISPPIRPGAAISERMTLR